MKLIYLSQSNLRNNFFIKEFVAAYGQQQGKAILLHEAFDTVSDTRFVTKRISSLLSEVMVVNAAFSGDQKGLFAAKDGELSIKTSLIEGLMPTVSMLILNPIQVENGESGFADPIALARALREKLPIEETLVLTVNSKSPVVQERKLVQGAEDLGNWLEVYEEERAALENAVALAPAYLSSTRIF